MSIAKVPEERLASAGLAHLRVPRPGPKPSSLCRRRAAGVNVEEVDGESRRRIDAADLNATRSEWCVIVALNSPHAVKTVGSRWMAATRPDCRATLCRRGRHVGDGVSASVVALTRVFEWEPSSRQDRQTTTLKHGRKRLRDTNDEKK